MFAQILLAAFLAAPPASALVSSTQFHAPEASAPTGPTKSREDHTLAAFVDWQTVDAITNWPVKTTVTFGRMGEHRWCEIQIEGKPTIRRLASTMQDALHFAVSDVLALLNKESI